MPPLAVRVHSFVVKLLERIVSHRVLKIIGSPVDSCLNPVGMGIVVSDLSVRVRVKVLS